MTFTWEHVLYRFYDQDGALLYVGITNSIPTRFKWHAAKQPWWAEVTDCRVQFLPDRAALERAEVDVIRYEQPRHNIRHASPAPVPVTAGASQAAVLDDEWAWMHYLPPYDRMDRSA